MLDRISALLSGSPRKSGGAEKQISERQLAAVALLIEVAYMDEHFEVVERRRITELISRYFDLDSSECEILMEEAEKAACNSGQLYEFTRIINDNYSVEERVELMELLWEVVYADGEVHDMEAGLLRKIGGLIYVSDKDRGFTQQRVARRAAGDNS
ncbi:MAG: TerB family tellurite resistance protein [Pseudomonadota bacterium]|nr:TerB family tellurite resistance protein [Pseudomonadota bacterium]